MARHSIINFASYVLLLNIVKEDYTSISTIVEFLPGETEKQISVQIRNDKRIERNETFELYLTAGVGVHLSPFPRTEITIENDDGKSILLRAIEA